MSEPSITEPLLPIFTVKLFTTLPEELKVRTPEREVAALMEILELAVEETVAPAVADRLPDRVRSFPASTNVPLVNVSVPETVKSEERVTVFPMPTLTATLFSPEPLNSTPATADPTI